MTDKPDSSVPSNDPPPPVRPKRGAFPTPKREIETALPYIAGSDEEGDDETQEPDPLTDVDGAEEDEDEKD